MTVSYETTMLLKQLSFLLSAHEDKVVVNLGSFDDTTPILVVLHVGDSPRHFFGSNQQAADLRNHLVHYPGLELADVVWALRKFLVERKEA